MDVQRAWCVIFVVAAACTCGARTECGETAQISFLTSIHDDPSCTKLSTKGVVLYEAAKLFAELHNNKTDELKIEITVLDTCEGITNALKAVMKALVWADINCLHPPYYLGIIGPDTITNIKAVHKVTSILKIPHIIKKPSISPYLHSLAEESDSYMVQGILRIIEILKWKSFTLITNVNDENDDIQNIAKRLMMSAIAKNLCVIIHDNNKEDYTTHIVHIGKPELKFFNESNAIILIIGKENLKNYVNRINSTNVILLLQDPRNIVDDLERRVKNSQWWKSENNFKKYNIEESKQLRWLENAIEIYTKALKALGCKNEKCKSQISLLDWNHVLSNTLMTHNAESQATSRFLDLFMKMKTSNLERLGGIIVRKNRTRIYWNESTLYEEQEKKGKEENKEEKEKKNVNKSRFLRARETKEDNDKDMPRTFRELLVRDNDSQTECVTTVKEIRMLREMDNETVQIFVSGVDDNEWWTMVCTISGVGIVMFLVGILAVYVIYANIRDAKSAKDKDHLDRDTSLRRMGSDGELSASINTHNHRTLRAPQRMNSNRSDVTEKSV